MLGVVIVLKILVLFYSQLPIDRSIVQGSRVGPLLYIVVEDNPYTLSQNNILFKYADDTTLSVLAYSY